MPDQAHRPPLIVPALAVGLGASIAMWAAWYLMHAPGLDAPASASVPVMGGLLVLGVLLGVASGGRAGRPGWLIGMLAGLVSAVLNQVLLLSNLVEQPATTEQMGESANRLAPGAPLVILGFVGACMVAGACAGAVGGMIGRRGARLSAQAWLGRLGAVAAASFLPLLVAGGAVTGTESAMAVPDSVTSYGAVSFLFPLSLMGEDRIFFEHAHRLLGSLVGLVTLIWAIATTVVDRRGGMKAAVWLAWLVVVVQGVLGAVRVGENSVPFAIAHGVFGQISFMIAVGVAAAQRPSYIEAPALVGETTRPGARRARTLGAFTLVAVIVQLVFGAMYRHMGSPHALYSHIGWSFVVLVLVILTGSLCMKAGKGDRAGRPLRLAGVFMHAIVAWQFVLGWLALWQVPPSEKSRPIPTADQLASAHQIDALEAVITTAHQASGALVLAASTLGLVWARRLSKRDPARNSPADAP